MSTLRSISCPFSFIFTYPLFPLVFLQSQLSQASLSFSIFSHFQSLTVIAYVLVKSARAHLLSLLLEDVFFQAAGTYHHHHYP